MRKSIEKIITDSTAKTKTLGFLKTIEVAVEEFLKSILVDALLNQFSMSMIVYGLFSAVFEIRLQEVGLK